MKPTQILVLLIIVILTIGYTSAASCKSKKKCKQNGGTCKSSPKCRAGFTEIRGACKGRGCICCAQQGSGCQCGKANPSRVVGGQVVSPKYKYPWMVWIKKDDWYQCGGSIINNRYILTAAHCLVDYNDCSALQPRNLKVIVADHNKDSTSDDVANTKTLTVSKIILHPDYDCNYLYDDIALLKLSKPLDFSSQRVQPACLPKDDSKTYKGEKATVTGWGFTQGGGPEQPSLLMEVEVPVIKCPGPGEYGEFLTPEMLCAGVVEGGKDACNGDSGGPLVVKEDNGRYVQVGVVSFGPLECTGPGIYTRVSKYLKWIKKQTKKAKTCSSRSSTSTAREPHMILFDHKKSRRQKVNRVKKVNYGK